MSGLLWFLAGGVVLGTPTSLVLLMVCGKSIYDRAQRQTRARVLLEFGLHPPQFECCNTAETRRMRRRSPNEQLVSREPVPERMPRPVFDYKR